MPKPVGWTMCFLLMTFVPIHKLCVNIYIYIYLYLCILSMSSGYRTYIYIHRGSVVQYWWSCTPSQSIGLVFGGAGFLCWMPLVVFFGFTNCVLLYDNKTNTRMLVTIGIHFKQHFDTRYFAFCNLSLPRMFFVPGLSFRISYSTWYHQTPLCHI